ncbi:MAG: hypothetical protein V4615_06795 [Bacteroidota bacterium]
MTNIFWSLGILCYNFVISQNTLTMNYPEIRIGHVKINHRDAKIIVCLIYCYSYQQIADVLQYKKIAKDGTWKYVNYTVYSIAGFTKALRGALEVDSDSKIVRKAYLEGFNQHGYFESTLILQLPEII